MTRGNGYCTMLNSKYLDLKLRKYLSIAVVILEGAVIVYVLLSPFKGFSMHTIKYNYKILFLRKRCGG